jgi:Ca-activated chloride channel family protein
MDGSSVGVATPMRPYETPMAQPAPSAQPTSQTSTQQPDVASVDEQDTEQAPLGGTFERTSADAFSTFAADVDTASYDVFRSTLSNLGALPPASYVRPEEFINSFDYGYAAPTRNDEHPFRINLQASQQLLGNELTHLRIGIQAVPRSQFEKKDVNLAFLVDTSGSMQDPTKLPLVKELLLDTLDELAPDDRVALVTYAGSTRVALESTRVSDRDAIEAAIDDLYAAGSTNGAGGLELAYQQVQDRFVAGGINHVILCTDGDFNVGPSTTDELVSLIENERDSGITLTVVGFGTGLNDAMMEAISDKGNGVYGAVATPEQAQEYAHERMLSNLQLIAKDLKIQVEFNPELVYAYRLVGYEDRLLADEQFLDNRADAGEVGAGHRVTAIYELALSKAELPDDAGLVEGVEPDLVHQVAAQDLVRVAVRYKDMDAAASDPSYEVSESLAAADIGQADVDLQWAVAVADFAEVLRLPEAATKSRLNAIDELVRPQASRDDARAEFVSMFDSARSLIESR